MKKFKLTILLIILSITFLSCVTAISRREAVLGIIKGEWKAVNTNLSMIIETSTISLSGEINNNGQLMIFTGDAIFIKKGISRDEPYQIRNDDLHYLTLDRKIAIQIKYLQYGLLHTVIFSENQQKEVIFIKK